MGMLRLWGVTTITAIAHVMCGDVGLSGKQSYTIPDVPVFYKY